MRIAVIPARGGSKRIKNKNIVDFMGKPMIAFALNAAMDSGLFDQIHVSTESEIIRDVVENLGFPVDFMRPVNLADDMTGLLPVLQHVLSEYENRGKSFEDVCCIMPAAPFLEPEDLKKAFDLYEQHQRKHPLLVMSHFPVPVEWAFLRDDHGFITPLFPDSLTKRSQDLPRAYYEAGPFNIFHANQLKGDNPLKDEKFISYIVPRDRAVDIDDPEDLEFAKVIFKGRQSMSE